MVELPGQFAVRGGIVDFFSPEAQRPVRIELLGDTVESVREFDARTQRSIAPVVRTTMLPLTEWAVPAAAVLRAHHAKLPGKRILSSAPQARKNNPLCSSWRKAPSARSFFSTSRKRSAKSPTNISPPQKKIMIATARPTLPKSPTISGPPRNSTPSLEKTSQILLEQLGLSLNGFQRASNFLPAPARASTATSSPACQK